MTIKLSFPDNRQCIKRIQKIWEKIYKSIMFLIWLTLKLKETKYLLCNLGIITMNNLGANNVVCFRKVFALDRLGKWGLANKLSMLFSMSTLDRIYYKCVSILSNVSYSLRRIESEIFPTFLVILGASSWEQDEKASWLLLGAWSIYGNSCYALHFYGLLWLHHIRKWNFSKRDTQPS